MKTILMISFLMISFALFAENGKFSTSEKKIVEKEVAQIPDSIRLKFDPLYEAWKTDWQANPQTMVSSNINDARKLKEFQALSNMGEIIIPLIVNKMMTDINGNLIGVVLYDAVQKDSSLKVDGILSEQNRIIKTIKVWTDSVKNKK